VRANCIEKSYEVGSLLFAVYRLLFLVYYSVLKYKVRSTKYEYVTSCHFELFWSTLVRENCIEKSYEVGSLLFAVYRLLFLVYYSVLKYKVRNTKYNVQSAVSVGSWQLLCCCLLLLIYYSALKYKVRNTKYK